MKKRAYLQIIISIIAFFLIYFFESNGRDAIMLFFILIFYPKSNFNEKENQFLQKNVFAGLGLFTVVAISFYLFTNKIMFLEDRYLSVAFFIFCVGISGLYLIHKENRKIEIERE